MSKNRTLTTMTDKDYREIVIYDAHCLDDFVYFLSRSDYEPIHHHT